MTDQPAPMDDQSPPEDLLGSSGDRAPRDPGDRPSAAMAWIAIVLLVGVVFTLQQLSAGVTAPTQHYAHPADTSGGELLTRMLVKLEAAVGDDASATTEATFAQYAEQAVLGAVTAPEQIRAAATVLLFGDPARAGEVLDAARTTLESDRADTETKPESHAEDLARIEANLAAFESLLDSEHASLAAAGIAFEGYWAELAPYLGPDGRLSEDDQAAAGLTPFAEAFGAGGTALLITLSAAFLIVTLAFLVGLVLLILAAVQLSSGKLQRRFKRPEPGGSVYLETAAVFIGAFLTVQIISGLIASVAPELATSVAMALQWLMLAAPLYAVVRGVSVKRLRHDLGLRAGGLGGIVRESAMGVVGYLATIPVYFAAVLLTLVLILLSNMVTSALGFGSGEPAGTPSNPIIEAVVEYTPTELFLMMTLAIVWAPLAEEIIFRGAFFRHLRSRVGFFLSGFSSAAVFALLHGYALPMLVPVFTLGICFAAMREWRGSLVAPIVAHFIHNAALMCTIVFVVTLIRS